MYACICVLMYIYENIHMHILAGDVEARSQLSLFLFLDNYLNQVLLVPCFRVSTSLIAN